MQLTTWSEELAKIKIEAGYANLSLDFITRTDQLAGYISVVSDESKLKLIHLFEGISHDLRAAWRKQIEEDPSLAPQPDEPQPSRCEVCGWPLAESREKGCVPGDCSYRPEQGSEEWHRIQQRKSPTAPEEIPY